VDREQDSYQGLQGNARIVPYGIVLHTKGARGPLVIVGEAFGVKQLDDGRVTRWLHPNEMGQPVSVYAQHEL